MAYVSKELIKEVRENLKKAFPRKDGWKLSVVRDNYSAIRVAIMEYPDTISFDDTKGENSLRDGHRPVNHVWIDDNVKKGYWTSEAGEVLKKITKIAMEKHWDASDIMTDYFHCAYYFTLDIGKWDRPAIAVSK